MQEVKSLEEAVELVLQKSLS